VKYLLLIYQDAGAPDWSDEDRDSLLAEYDRFNAEVGARGILVGGAELHPVSTATTVRVRDGRTLLTDGPFAETKEQLAGYYVVECDSLDEALGIAAAIPSSRLGSIEVRPQVEGQEPQGLAP
jgi:hypothetical protein